ncbi:LysR family transcriptional regulator [Epibacterium sp. SM1979]|uniref:LysR family transcriptional regulator n=1 Tax=Tritonibacter litoralis TaxID=2662264 RepID=A0A843YIN0_9RHOB|nr:LysR family transcriptional regulator [Tritonibacter litoralis]MQQ09658.1 LysR family transcriptional regulator [Tritonibacter litoralis]
MDDQLIRTTLRVAREGSFAAAARVTGVDPSSISRQVAALEQALGIRVFERTTRRLTLTEAGRIYLDRVTAALDAIDEAADAAREAMSEPSGRLRVTASVAFGERWLVPKLTEFRAKYPQIELELRLTDRVMDLSGEGIDLALRLGPPPERGAMVAAKLFDTSYRVVASPQYLARAGRPQTPADLQHHDGLLFDLPAFQNNWSFRARAGGPVVPAAPRAVMTISNALALRRAALCHLGVALLADWTIDADLRSGALIDLFPHHTVSAGQFNSAAWILYVSRDYVPARLRVFIDHLKQKGR